MNPIHAEEKPFVIGDLHGQLGNQCFEVAATLSHAWDHDAEALFPDLIHKKTEGVPSNRDNVFWRLSVKSPGVESGYYYEEPYFHFAEIPYQPNMRMHGYFQSESYFRHHKDKICALFDPKEETYDFIIAKYGDLLSHPTTVSIHFRSYKIADPNRTCYFLNGREYVEKAMSYFSSDALFIVFSDDINWCKENLRDLAPNMYFVEGEEYHNDFYFMSLCDHNIIANSTFSWWSAYLNKNPHKIVIAPKKWFHESCNIDTKDLIPKEWIVL